MRTAVWFARSSLPNENNITKRFNSSFSGLARMCKRIRELSTKTHCLLAVVGSSIWLPQECTYTSMYRALHIGKQNGYFPYVGRYTNTNYPYNVLLVNMLKSKYLPFPFGFWFIHIIAVEEIGLCLKCTHTIWTLCHGHLKIVAVKKRELQAYVLYWIGNQLYMSYITFLGTWLWHFSSEDNLQMFLYSWCMDIVQWWPRCMHW